MRHFLLPFLTTAFFLWGSPAWADPDSLFAEYVNKAADFIKTGQPDSAAYFENAAARHFRQTDSLKSWIKLYQKLGATCRDSGRYEEALGYFFKGLNQQWRRPANKEELEALAWFYTHIGYTYAKLDDKLAVVKWYEHAAAILRDTLGIEDARVARAIYSQLGNACNRLRDYQRAEFFHEKRLRILTKAKNWDKAAGACNDLGMVYFNMENYPLAIETFQAGIQFDSVSADYRILLLANLAMTFIKNGDLAGAFSANRQCEKIIRDSALPPEEKKGDFILVYENYARCYREKRQYLLAEKYCSNALKLQKEIDPDNHRGAALLQILWGDIFQSWGKWEEALASYRAALQNFIPSFQGQDPTSLPAASQLPAEPNLIEAFAGIAACLMGKHQSAADWKAVGTAMQAYELAISVENQLLRNYVLEGSRLTALKEHRWYREEALAVAYGLWQKEKTGEAAARMFAISEQSRAFLLLETVQVTSTFGQSQEEDSGLRSRYFQLNERIAGLEEAAGSGRSAEELDSLKMALVKAKDERAAVVEKILNNYPELNFLNKNQAAALRAVQQVLGPDRMLVEYFVGEKRLFTFAVTASGFSAWVRPLPPDFNEKIFALKTALTDNPVVNLNKNKPVFAQSAYQLYRWLMQDALAWKPSAVRRLAIVPDGLLGYLPFELLTREETKGDFYYHQPAYLLKDFSTGYAPSAELFVLQTRKETGRAGKNLAGFAPSYAEMPVASAGNADQLLLAELVRSGEYDLKGTKDEVRFATRLLGGKAFLDGDASEANFKKWASGFRVLLLSMHSLVNEDDPQFSRLLFTRDASGEQDDDLLLALELPGIRLQADLAVLSACNTGFGKLYAGEGVMSLSGAFFAAGVPSTVMTLWKIPDATSPIIVKEFFKNLAAGMPKDVALQQAKLTYLGAAQTPEEMHPYHWAGFIASGNMEPLSLQPVTPSWVWMAGVVALGGLFFYFFKKNRKLPSWGSH